MTEGDALDQTQYIQQRVYTDPSLRPSPLDLHSASALGNYECVQEAISSNKDINRRNKGNTSGICTAKCNHFPYNLLTMCITETDLCNSV